MRTLALTPGTRLGPYEISSILGAGGMGEVYKARDTRLDRIVAVKILHDQFSERFDREARAVAALNHPHICQLYDVGPNYLVMEFVEGGPIRPGGSPEKLFDVALQIADGLAAAHAAGIVHRDLKPGNILVNSSGHVTILDFGVALMTASEDVTEARRTVAITAPGTTMGTAAYMSPEQARGLTVDARSDLWSLGVVLYELATGVRPFDGPTAPVIFEALLGKPLVPARERNPNVPVELEHIIGRLLEKDRETRYQSAADLRADLKRVERDSSSGRVAAAAHPPEPRRFGYAAPVLIGLALVLVAAGVRLLYFPNAPITSPSEYTQITNFTDSATAPNLSPDGRMVTFIRGGDYFLSRGQIYVKLLPNGESVRLTSEPASKFAPVFTPDGSRIAYTVTPTEGSASWDTWTVPVLGGQPTRLLPNASGLTWLDDHRVLFSEIKTGLHMGIVTATDSRTASREIYFPAHERAMAHFSYASPNRNWALVVEMDRTGAWQPCRLVPLDGRSAGRQVGPQGLCTAASWSPDGKWMYFGAQVGGNAHLWRQQFPDGTPEQMTFGPTDEEGIALAPDGRSLITSVGVRQSANWIHDATGDHLISSEGFAFDPKLSVDGKRAYYLLRQNAMSSDSELCVVDLASGKTDHVLPGFPMAGYDISRDETEVVFTAAQDGSERQIWLASVDRRSPPRQVTQAGDQVSFGANGELVFRLLEEKVNFLYRIRKDGSGRERISSVPVINVHSVSPDGEWVIARAAAGEDPASVPTIAVPIRGGVPRTICSRACSARWSSDGRFFYVTDGNISPNSSGKTFAVPVPPGRSLPEPPASGVGSAADWLILPGTQVIERASVSPGPDPSTYVFAKTDLQRNLFRIPLH